MSSYSQEKVEWNCLKEGERNCLIWPDLLPWGNEQHVQIKRGIENGDLGVISTVVQNPETRICYNIIKQIKEGMPAAGMVEQFDWITAVDGKLTTRVKESEELINLTRNGKDNVCLTIRRATDCLACVKEWSKEKKVELKIHSKDLGFRLSHFYLKDKDATIKDCILIFDVSLEERAKSKPSRQLYRGDELLSINGQHLTGKKLKDIYDIFFKSPRQVVMDVKPIIRAKELEEKLKKAALRSPDQIYWSQQKEELVVNASESTLGFQILSNVRKNSLENEFFHIVSKVTEGTPAARANLPVGVRLLSVNDHNLTCLEKTEVADLIHQQKGDLKLLVVPPERIKPHQLKKRRSSLRRVSSSQTSANSPTSGVEFMNNSPQFDLPFRSEVSGEALRSRLSLNSTKTDGSDRQAAVSKKKTPIVKAAEQDNEAYVPSDSQSNEDLCKTCNEKQENGMLERFPDDKLLWKLSNIEFISFNEICDGLDRDIIKSGISEVATCLGFSPQEIRKICQMYSGKGGIGAARTFLEKWSGGQTNNIGEFRKILGSDQLKRGDIINLIDKWSKKDVCYGCGCLINTR